MLVTGWVGFGAVWVGCGIGVGVLVIVGSNVIRSLRRGLKWASTRAVIQICRKQIQPESPVPNRDLKSDSDGNDHHNISPHVLYTRVPHRPREPHAKQPQGPKQDTPGPRFSKSGERVSLRM